jgi:hypothetical protein
MSFTGPWCALLHPLRSHYLFDPSGPLLDERGVWHLWEDEGSWSHWTSRDLVHWEGALVNGTNFSQDTGAVSVTPAGTYAFWPLMDGRAPITEIASAVALTPVSGPFGGPAQWKHRGTFEYNAQWWLVVGCGSVSEGAQCCLFEAADATLANFTDRGSIFTTNLT